MESLGYVLLYFLRGGRLPWHGIPFGNDCVEKTGELKQSISIEDLCAGLPGEFAEYFRHVRSLRFESRPDYRHLRRIFRNLFGRERFENDNVFDWTILKFLIAEDDAQSATVEDSTSPCAEI